MTEATRSTSRVGESPRIRAGSYIIIPATLLRETHSAITQYAVPTSLSNDGFCAPQSSLTLHSRRRSLPTDIPYALVIDTEICKEAPLELWCSGVGDLAAKLTAVTDWRLALSARGTPMNDFAALLSDAPVFQFLGRPSRDTEGTRLLATALSDLIASLRPKMPISSGIFAQ